MYGIFTYINGWFLFMVNVVKYTIHDIHGSYGIGFDSFSIKKKQAKWNKQKLWYIPTSIAMEHTPCWWYLPGKVGGYDFCAMLVCLCNSAGDIFLVWKRDTWKRVNQVTSKDRESKTARLKITSLWNVFFHVLKWRKDVDVFCFIKKCGIWNHTIFTKQKVCWA